MLGESEPEPDYVADVPLRPCHRPPPPPPPPLLLAPSTPEHSKRWASHSRGALRTFSPVSVRFGHLAPPWSIDPLHRKHLEYGAVAYLVVGSWLLPFRGLYDSQHARSLSPPVDRPGSQHASQGPIAGVRVPTPLLDLSLYDVQVEYPYWTRFLRAFWASPLRSSTLGTSSRYEFGPQLGPGTEPRTSAWRGHGRAHTLAPVPILDAPKYQVPSTADCLPNFTSPPNIGLQCTRNYAVPANANANTLTTGIPATAAADPALASAACGTTPRAPRTCFVSESLLSDFSVSGPNSNPSYSDCVYAMSQLNYFCGEHGGLKTVSGYQYKLDPNDGGNC
ncbi:hypothetical protein B0H15DRAFT_955292 [Mycena belliarum]|uniref:Uncharacterized protein n=1 Tax=Mycena belliarum TaxID=1033014 RepID=A0AAD6XII9_9AGAR|nr:hypothetical protein B0H15DRAFT_955292 [Mycena belliae]